MTWSTYYQTPIMSHWQGRHDVPPGASFFQIVKPLNLLNPTSPSPRLAFALLGFCCDEGIRRNLGRVGAADGPNALRQVLSKLSYPRPDCDFFDAGDITCLDQNLEAAQQALSEAVFLLLKNNITPILIGGGHEIAFGHYQGIRRCLEQKSLGIINFDAHFDMRPLLSEQQGSSGTPFLQIAAAEHKANQTFHYTCLGIQQASTMPQLFETAKKYNVDFICADDIMLSDKAHALLEQSCHRDDYIYASMCLDVFAAAFAPGVSAPQSVGITPWHMIPLLRKMSASQKIISYDIAELSPKYDIDAHTAKLAAHLIFEIIHHHQPK